MSTTPPTIQCSPGAVVLVNFRFPDQSGMKRRPAVVISVDAYHDSRVDAVMIALSSQPEREYFGDCHLEDWQAAGLVQPTKAKGVIATIICTDIARQLGSLSSRDFARVQGSVQEIVGL